MIVCLPTGEMDPLLKEPLHNFGAVDHTDDVPNLQMRSKAIKDGTAA